MFLELELCLYTANSSEGYSLVIADQRIIGRREIISASVNTATVIVIMEVDSSISMMVLFPCMVIIEVKINIFSTAWYIKKVNLI